MRRLTSAPIRSRGMRRTSATVTENAAAKINLSLDIVQKRPDGYHELDSVMQTVSLTDEIVIRAVSSVSAFLPRIKLTVDNPELSEGENNLAYRAAQKWFEAAGKHSGIEGRTRSGETSEDGDLRNIRATFRDAKACELEIILKKRIPLEAGMGGGSADAAAVLRGLNRLAASGALGDLAPLPKQILAQVALSLGADVPFCLNGGTARCRGIGEIIEPLRPLPHWSLLIVVPDIHISTAEAFGKFDAALPNAQERTLPQAASGSGDQGFFCSDVDALLAAIDDQNLERMSRSACNIFYDLVSCKQDIIRAWLELLQASGAVFIRMTGSGPTLFAIYEETKERDRAERELRQSSLAHRGIFAAELS